MRRRWVQALGVAVLSVLAVACVGGPGPSSACGRLRALEPDVSSLSSESTVGAARSTLERTRVVLESIESDPSLDASVRRLDGSVDEAWNALRPASDDAAFDNAGAVEAGARVGGALDAVLKRCG